MRDPWTEKEWLDLCQRVKACAEHLATEGPRQASHLKEAAAEFCDQPPPDHYLELLARVRMAAEKAKSWQQRGASAPGVSASEEESPNAAGTEAAGTQAAGAQGAGTKAEETKAEGTDLESVVDETLDESFPASDPPSWTSAAL
jgi:hypothetical protein